MLIFYNFFSPNSFFLISKEMDELRAYFYTQYYNDPGGTWIKSTACFNDGVKSSNNLVVYLNFDECNGYSGMFFHFLHFTIFFCEGLHKVRLLFCRKLNHTQILFNCFFFFFRARDILSTRNIFERNRIIFIGVELQLYGGFLTYKRKSHTCVPAHSLRIFFHLLYVDTDF